MNMKLLAVVTPPFIYQVKVLNYSAKSTRRYQLRGIQPSTKNSMLENNILKTNKQEKLNTDTLCSLKFQYTNNNNVLTFIFVLVFQNCFKNRDNAFQNLICKNNDRCNK